MDFYVAVAAVFMSHVLTNNSSLTWFRF